MQHDRNMNSRINLQTIGTMINQDLVCREIDYSSFQDRENIAYKEMEKALNQIIGESETNAIIEEIMIYGDTIFQIQFSQGLKAGATLQLKLISNFDTDI